MTLDIYAHASPGLQQAAARGFDKVFDKVRDAIETRVCVTGVEIDVAIRLVSKNRNESPRVVPGASF